MNRKTPSLRLLLVEDNRHDVLAFKRSLKASEIDYQITHHTRAEAALAQLTTSIVPFDLLVCDHNLPGLSGFDLCKALLARKISIPMVLLTGAGAEVLAVEALKAGVNDYIVKDPNQGYLNLLPVILPDVVRNYNERLARRRVEDLLAKRERYLAALVKVQQILLAQDSQDNHYTEILKLLGQTANASRAYIFKNQGQEAGCLLSRQIAAWSADKVDPAPETSPLPDTRLAEMLPRWAALLEQKGVISGSLTDFSDSEQKTLKARGILAILILPLFVNGQFFGFIGFDNCVEAHSWESAEIDLLKAAAASISIWQERRFAEEKLRRYTTALQARNEELDAFAHTVAHDLKNPLSALTGMAEVLAVDYQSDPELVYYLRSIVRSSQKANNIVNELLLLASVRKQKEIKLVPLNMARIVSEAQERLVHVIEQSQAELILPASWPTAMGYAPWIEEVWANYISNAVKYGGQPPRLELGAAEQNDGQVRFWVRDNGPGLTLQQQAQLFTPFTKLKQARAKGHGLGLSIVRRIIQKLGGQVGVQSGPTSEQGSTFYFSLPKAYGSGNQKTNPP